MSRLMSLERIKGRIKMVVELTERNSYTNIKSLSEDSGMPKYQLQALLITGFLYKKDNTYYCQDIFYWMTDSLKDVFFSELAEAVQAIYRHKESSHLIDVERILESAKRKNTENLIPERGVTITKKRESFWNKLKNFFK